VSADVRAAPGPRCCRLERRGRGEYGTLDLLRSLVEASARWCPPPLHPPPPPLPGVLLSLLVVAALVALGRRRGPRAAVPAAS